MGSRYNWGKSSMPTIIDVRRTICFLTFRFPGRCCKVSNLLMALDVSKKGNTFLAIWKILLLCIKEIANKKHTAYSKIAWVFQNKQPKPNYCLRNIFIEFLSYQAHFASCHQSGCYIRQSLNTYSTVKKNCNYYFFYVSKETFQLFKL